MNDRLRAVYYADHHLRSADALAIARREAAVRGDEIYAQDTLGWAAAQDNEWAAQRAMRRAIRYETEDPSLQYHAAIVALHFGRTAEAKRRLEQALALNSHFDPIFAEDARRRLAALTAE